MDERERIEDRRDCGGMQENDKGDSGGMQEDDKRDSGTVAGLNSLLKIPSNVKSMSPGSFASKARM